MRQTFPMFDSSKLSLPLLKTKIFWHLNARLYGFTVWIAPDIRWPEKTGVLSGKVRRTLTQVRPEFKSVWQAGIRISFPLLLHVQFA